MSTGGFGWWGLNDYIQEEAEKLQKDLKNVNVLALDLYDSKVATTRDDAMKYVGEAKQERVRAVINGAFDYVGAKAQMGTIGWCYGGGWSLQTADAYKGTIAFLKENLVK